MESVGQRGFVPVGRSRYGRRKLRKGRRPRRRRSKISRMWRNIT